VCGLGVCAAEPRWPAQQDADAGRRAVPQEVGAYQTHRWDNCLLPMQSIQTIALPSPSHTKLLSTKRAKEEAQGPSHGHLASALSETEQAPDLIQNGRSVLRDSSDVNPRGLVQYYRSHLPSKTPNYSSSYPFSSNHPPFSSPLSTSLYVSSFPLTEVCLLFRVCRWLLQPLSKEADILSRQRIVASLVQDPSLATSLAEVRQTNTVLKYLSHY
jgi:hypothetical protein